MGEDEHGGAAEKCRVQITKIKKLAELSFIHRKLCLFIYWREVIIMDGISVILCLVLAVIFIGFFWALAQSYSSSDWSFEAPIIRVLKPQALDALEISLIKPYNSTATIILTDLLTQTEKELLSRAIIDKDGYYTCTSDECPKCISELMGLQKDEDSSILNADKKEL